MKRDMDLVRDILLKVEAKASPSRLKDLLPPNPASAHVDTVAEHVRMLVSEAGLLVGVSAGSHGGPDWINLKLTWQGHEFLDVIRDEKIWRQTKEQAAKAGGFSLELLGALAKGLIKTAIQKQTGIELEL